MPSRFSHALLRENFTSKWLLWSRVEAKNFTKNKLFKLNKNRLYVSRLKSELSFFRKKRQENERFIDDTLKTRGIKYLNVENWLLLFPPYQNFWLRACHFIYFICLWCNTRIVTIGRKVYFLHKLRFITKQKSQFGCGYLQMVLVTGSLIQNSNHSKTSFSMQIVSLSRHLCSRRDAREDNHTYAKKIISRKKLQAKFKCICIEQNRKYLYPVVINTNGRKSNFQRNHYWYLTQHRNIELHSCTSSKSRSFFKRVFYLKQISAITGGPLERPARDNCPVAHPINPALTRPWAVNILSVAHRLRNPVLW